MAEELLNVPKLTIRHYKNKSLYDSYSGSRNDGDISIIGDSMSVYGISVIDDLVSKVNSNIEVNANKLKEIAESGISQINGKIADLKAITYTKVEADNKFQPKGEYVTKNDYMRGSDTWHDELDKKADKDDVYTKIESDGKFLTKTDVMNKYLTTTDAANKYLTTTDAANKYLTKTAANGTYLTQSKAESTYATKSDLANIPRSDEDYFTLGQEITLSGDVTGTGIFDGRDVLTIVTTLVKECGVVDGNVSNPDAWWIKLGGKPSLIIQGGRYTTQITSSDVKFSISYSRDCFSVVATLFDTYTPCPNAFIQDASKTGFELKTEENRHPTNWYWISVGI